MKTNIPTNILPFIVIRRENEECDSKLKNLGLKEMDDSWLSIFILWMTLLANGIEHNSRYEDDWNSHSTSKWESELPIRT